MAKVRKPRTPRRAPAGKVPEKNYDDWVHNQMVEINQKIELEKKQIARYHTKRAKLSKVKMFKFPARPEPDPQSPSGQQYHASTFRYKDWNKATENLPPLNRLPTYKQAVKQHDDSIHAVTHPQMQFKNLHYMHGSKAHTNSLREVGYGVVEGDKEAVKIWDTMRMRGGGFEQLPPAKRMQQLSKRKDEAVSILRSFDRKYN